jgi:hypothetical protein
MNMFVGATLNVTGGSVGTVLADRASAVNISGGSVSTVGLFNGGTLTMTGGSLPGLNAQSGGIVKISGGSVGNFARATAGSNVTISGGQIGTSFACVLGSTVAISGGLIGNGFGAGAGSTVTISGGAFGDAFQNLTGNLMRLLGGEFRINGTLVTGLDVVGSTKLVTVPTSGLLSGVFADGTPFAFASPDGDAINSVMLMAAQLPPIGSSLIDLPGSAAPAGIRNGQALNVDSGGQLPDNFNAGLGSTLHVYAGGAVGKNLEVLGANVDVLGGSIGDGFDAFSGSTITVRGGSIGESFTAHSGSTVDLQGGAISAFFQALAGSTVNLFGTDFFLNGTAITPLTMGQPFLLTSRTGTLSGHLADGSAFIFPFQTATRVGTQVLVSPDATLMLTLVPEPSGACVGTCGIGLFAMCLRRRSH